MELCGKLCTSPQKIRKKRCNYPMCKHMRQR